MTDWKKLQRALKYARRNPGKKVLLSNLAAETGQSLFHAHRTLRAVLGETPKHFTLRLRVDRAAAALITSPASILASRWLADSRAMRLSAAPFDDAFR